MLRAIAFTGIGLMLLGLTGCGGCGGSAPSEPTVASNDTNDGYGADGFNSEGYDREGYNRESYNSEGFNREGLNAEGYNREGMNAEGFDRDGFNAEGVDKEGYNREGFSSEGFDRKGFNAEGLDSEGFNVEGFDAEAYNRNGFNAEGYDRQGFNAEGYDRDGFNVSGYDRDGFNREGIDASGNNREGVAADGSERPKTFAELAHQAFREGRDGDAFRYLYADVLTADSASEGQLDMHWISGLKRPAMAVRWGIGVNYVAPRTFEGSPHPIGSEPQERKDTGREGEVRRKTTREAPERRNENPGNGQGAVATRSQSLNHYTGELGAKVVARLQANTERGLYGAAVKNALTRGPGEGDGSENVDGSGGSFDGNANEPGKAAIQVQPLAPGVVMLGQGEPAELLDAAAKEGVDVLLVFEVNVTEARATGLITNNTEWHFYDAQKRLKIGTTKGPNNLQVQFAREANRGGKDPVDDSIETLFQLADKNFAVAEMPQLLPEHATARVTSLVASEYRNPLPVLTEIRYYNRGKLLGDAETSQAYQRLIGQEKGTALAGGSPDQKLAAIDGYLPAGHPRVKLPGAESDVPRGGKPKSPPPVGFPSIPEESRPAEGESSRVEIPGLGLSLVPPPGFEVVRDGDKVSLKNGEAQVTIQRRTQPLSTAAEALSPANLAKGDYTLITKQDLPLAGREGVLAVANHSSGYSYWFALIKESDEETIAITAMCPDGEVLRLADSLRKALMSAQLAE
jgi:hypothetical protein